MRSRQRGCLSQKENVMSCKFSRPTYNIIQTTLVEYYNWFDSTYNIIQMTLVKYYNWFDNIVVTRR